MALIIDPIKKHRQEASQKSRQTGKKMYINDIGDGNYKVESKQGVFCVTAYKNGSEVCV